MRHKIEALMLLAIASIFAIFGFLSISKSSETPIFGLGFLVIGIGAAVSAFIHAARGDRLVVKIDEGNITIGGYLRKTEVAIASIISVDRGVDSVIILHSTGRLVVDETYFKDPDAADHFVKAITEKIKVNK